jgi:hypothetical protein
MWRSIFNTILKIFIASFIFILQIAAANLLPPPWNRLNLIFIAAMLIMIFNRQNQFVWYLFGLSLMSELFHSSPFGLNTAALCVSIAALDWLLINKLTNRFFPIVFIAGLIGVFTYRSAYLIMAAISHLIFGTAFALSAPLALDFLFEMLINAALLTVIYLIPALFIKKLNPRYLSDR